MELVPHSAGWALPETEAVGEAAVEGTLPVLARCRVCRHRLDGLCCGLVQVRRASTAVQRNVCAPSTAYSSGPMIRN